MPRLSGKRLLGMAAAGVFVTVASAAATSARTPDPIPTASVGPARTYSYDIAAQSLDGALRAFAHTTRQPVLFNHMLVGGKRSAGVNGTHSGDDGMTLLLIGTGLKAGRGSRGAYVITADTPPARAATLSRRPPVEDAVGNTPEIVVTARKREEHPFDVPIAITVFPGLAVTRRGATNLVDLLPDVPGVGGYDFGNGNQKITIRGVSTSLGANENGYYLDDLPFSGVTVPISPDVRAWDIDRVEVLRGPQGTLFGEGSMGGTIRTLTRNADLTQWSAAGEIMVSVTAGGGANRGAKGVVNVLLLRDVLAIRIVGTTEHFDGWINDSATSQRRANDQDYHSLRTRLRFDPSDRLSISGSYWRYRGSFANGNSSATDNNELPRSGAFSSRLDYDLLGASATYDLNGAALFYGYSHNSFQLPQQGVLLGDALQVTTDIRLDTHELRLASQRPGALQWTIGAYQRSATRSDSSRFDKFGIDNVTRTVSEARALFGEATCTLPGLPIDVTAGLRYFAETIGNAETNGGGALPVAPGRRQGFDSFNPRFSLAWRPDTGITTYLSVAKGFRSGQLQPGVALRLADAVGVTLPENLRQDSIWTWEAGVKARLLDGIIMLEAAAYGAAWQDVAVRIPIGDTGIQGLINSNGTRTVGVEASVTAKPGSGLTVSAHASYIDADYRGSVPGTAITDGARVEDVAAFTAGATLDFQRPLTDRMGVSAQLNFQHSSARTSNASPDWRPGDRINRVDARAGITLPFASLSIFIDNLTNEQGAVSYRTVTALNDGVVDSVANRLRPRTIGIRADFALGR
jgi:iron complex outermembrane recepter protein